MELLKKNSKLILVINQTIDILVISLAFWAALKTRGLHLDSSPSSYVLFYFISTTCCHLSLRLFSLYDPLETHDFSQIFSKIVQATLTGSAGIIFILFTLHMDAISRFFLGFLVVYQILFLSISKALLFRTSLLNHDKDYNTLNVLIIGTRNRAIDLIKEIHSYPASDYYIHGCLETNDKKCDVGKTVIDDISIIGTMSDLKDILRNKVIDEILFALPLNEIDHIHQYIFIAENMGINIRILPDFQIQRIMYHPGTANIFIESFLGIPTMSLSSTPHKSLELTIKSVIDYSLAVLGTIVCLPLFILLGIAIKINSKGPILFTQTRSGLNGRDFTLYKFRTMVEDAEVLRSELDSANEMDGPVFKIKDDPRTTAVGRFLRKTSLDELPQLLNILKGEMSLVGPRPPLPSEVEKYHTWQRRRLSMKPGLTCIWQVSGRNNIPFEQWMNMDLEYIDNWSLLLDFKLLALTVKEVISSKGQ